MRMLFREFHDQLQDLGTVRAAVDIIAEKDEQIVILIPYLGPEREQPVPVAVDIANGQQTTVISGVWYEDETVLVPDAVSWHACLFLADFF